MRQPRRRIRPSKQKHLLPDRLTRPARLAQTGNDVGAFTTPFVSDALEPQNSPSWRQNRYAHRVCRQEQYRHPSHEHHTQPRDDGDKSVRKLRGCDTTSAIQDRETSTYDKLRSPGIGTSYQRRLVKNADGDHHSTHILPRFANDGMLCASLPRPMRYRLRYHQNATEHTLQVTIRSEVLQRSQILEQSRRLCSDDEDTTALDTRQI